jgi:arylsulfatase A-like enzyme
VRHERLDPSHNYGFSGHHGPIGIIAAAGPSVAHAEIEGAQIADLAPTVLALLGVQAETAFDGRPLAAFAAALDPVALGAAEGAVSEQTVYSGEEERAISERLEALGYE